MKIKKLIVTELKKKGEVRAADIVSKTGFSRTYVNRIFQQLQQEGNIRLVGKANRARYIIASTDAVDRARTSELQYHKILVNDHLEEDRVLAQIKKETGIFRGTSKNIIDIVDYAFTEMLNNAIEHSQSERITVKIERTSEGILFMIDDRGIGIFQNIMRTKKLRSEREAIQDLLKGKHTTIPDRHSGEGIFFTSKAADSLAIKSSGKKLLFDNLLTDIFLRDVKTRIGTQVDFWISLQTKRKLASVFRQYTGDEFAFDKTDVSVKLFKMDSGFVSRSQARRVLAGLEKFKTIVLDFRNVAMVGQGFIDEVFRVWTSKHPKKTIEVRNANENVHFMIEHVSSTF